MNYSIPYKLLDWISMEKINWDYLSKNPNAMRLLEENQEKIKWEYLSSNPSAIHLIEANRDKINWYMLSGNPAAIHLLEANQDKIGFFLSSNPNIFEIDKKQYNIDINKKANNIEQFFCQVKL